MSAKVGFWTGPRVPAGGCGYGLPRTGFCGAPAAYQMVSKSRSPLIGQDLFLTCVEHVVLARSEEWVAQIRSIRRPNPPLD